MAPRRSLVRWLSAASFLSLLTVGLANSLTTPLQAATTYNVQTLSPFAGSEIVDISFDDKYAAVVGKNDTTGYGLRLINLTTKARVEPPFLISNVFPPSALGLSEPRASSVAISPVDPSGIYYALVTIREARDMPANPAQPLPPGKAVLLNINASNGAISPRPGVQPITVGVNPESVDISKDGAFAIVANQGDGVTKGSISVIDMRLSPPQVVQNIAPAVTNDPTPETVEISDNSQQAFVALQKANAISVLDINTSVTPLQVSPRVFKIGTGPGGTPTLGPDGIAVSPDGQYLVAANEQASPRSVSLYRVGAPGSASPLTLLDTVNTPTDPSIAPIGYTPEMAATGFLDGAVKAFFTFQQPNGVGVYRIDTAANKLVYEQTIALAPGAPANDVGPEGIAFAQSLNMLVTANSENRTASLIQATVTGTPTPTPIQNAIKQFLPVTQK